MQKKFSGLKVHTQKSAGTESHNSSNLSLVASSFICDRERRILEYLDENKVFFIDVEDALHDDQTYNSPKVT